MGLKERRNAVRDPLLGLPAVGWTGLPHGRVTRLRRAVAPCSSRLGSQRGSLLPGAQLWADRYNSGKMLLREQTEERVQRPKRDRTRDSDWSATALKGILRNPLSSKVPQRNSGWSAL